MLRISRLILSSAMALGFCNYLLASSTARIVVSGTEQAGDASSITISFSDSNGNTYSKTVGYGTFSTTASIASSIGASFANTYVPGGKLSAQVYCGTTNSVLFKLKGTATFGNLTVTGSTTSFQLASSGFASSPAPTNPTITWPAPAAITSGTALSGTQLNATANVPGVFTYFPGAGTVLDAGTQILSTIFTPTDTITYATVSASVTLVVNAAPTSQQTPVISWPTPASIYYGTPLSSTQLNATASYNGVNVPGTFEYSPGTGEVLEAGNQPLLVAFFPNDSVHYATAGGSVSLTVNSGTTTPLAIYSYSLTAPGGGSGFATNGNLQNYSDSVTGTWAFSYDPLNRLTSGSQSGGLNNCWAYDAFGNRTAQVAQSASCPTETSQSATVTYNSSNQITWVQGMGSGVIQYDAAGNVSQDNINKYLYDGEGRICAVQNLAVGTMTQYLYDAEGRRVAKGSITSWSCDLNINSSTGKPNSGFAPSNLYVIGPSGEQLTETDGQGNWLHTNVYAAGSLIATYDLAPTGEPALHFQLEDWLGTRRVQTDISGNVEETFSSLPFGDGLAASSPTGAPSTADDATENHFTGKERDAESGNDYFGARYMASSMGRWLSPDVVNITEERMINPSSTLNKYAYAANNPLKYVDPDGQDIVLYFENGVPGHIMMMAYDPSLPRAAYRSFGPAEAYSRGHWRSVGTLFGAPASNKFGFDELKSADAIRTRFASITIKTNPAVTQQVVQALLAHSNDRSYAIFGGACASSCERILRQISQFRGVTQWSDNLLTPYAFFDGAYNAFGNGTAATTQPLGNGDTYKQDIFTPGTNYGRDQPQGWNEFDVLNLLINQTQPMATRTCTIVVSPHGNSGDC